MGITIRCPGSKQWERLMWSLDLRLSVLAQGVWPTGIVGTVCELGIAPMKTIADARI